MASASTMKMSSCFGINRSGFYCSPKSVSLSKRVRCSSSSPESQSSRYISKGCKLIGCGSGIPKQEFCNDDLAKIVDTSDEWISTRTGIRSRRILTGKENLTTLAVEASRKALEMAEVNVDDVDLILFCSSSPDQMFGGAPEVQKALGCKRNPPAFDIRAACSGFLLGVVTASSYIRGGNFTNVLVIGADNVSRYLDWTDKKTCVLFGDAAGAVLVQACDREEDGLFGFDLHTDGCGSRHVYADIKHIERNMALDSNGTTLGFSPTRPSISFIHMNGQEVYRFAVNVVPKSIEASLAKARLKLSDIDWLLLHQANMRIIDRVATKLEFPKDRVISNLANYANTSAASIPLALDEAVRSGKVKEGETMATAGFGGGLTWGSAIVRWC